jgi:zinc protease
MRLNKFAGLIWLVLLGCMVQGTGRTTVMENIKIKNIDNGLKLAVWEDHRSNVVEIRIYIKTGSVYEQEYPGSGISHFLEHITAEGPTLKKSRKEVDDLMIKFGNAFNAYTSKSHTCYHITTTGEFYREAVELLGELVFENKITEEAFKREKGVIQREIEKSDEEPVSYLYRLASENLYKVSPAKFPVIGYKELLRQISMDNLINYYNKKYVPNNAVVVVGGNVDAAEVISLVNEKMGVYKRNFYETPALPAEPEILNIREMQGVKDVEGTYLNLSWQTISVFHPDLYALDLLSEVLSSGRNARLDRILKEKKQLVNSIDSYSHTPSYGKGDFTITSRFKDSEIAEVEAAILDIVEDIKKNGVSKKEIERAKKLAVSGYLFEKTSISGNTSKIGVDLITTNDENFSYNYVENLKKVTPEDIKRAANKYLSKSNYARTMIVSKQNKKGLEKEENVRESQVKKITLDNGIRVILKDISDVSVVNYAVFFKGGQTYDKIYNQPGVFSFYGSMLSKGTKKYSREELAEEFEKLGAGFSTSSGNNTFYVKAASLTEDYGKIIDLVNEIITNPAFDEEEIKKLKKFTIQAIEQQKNDWQKEAYLNYKKHIFPEDTPYVYSSLGTIESVKGIDSEMLRKVHDEFVHPSNMVVSIAGDFDVAAMEKKLRVVFSKLKDSEKNIPDYNKEILQLDKSITENYKTAKDLAVIFMGFPTVTVFDVNTRVTLDIVDSIISGSGYPSGWLHDRLRGEQLVYVVHAYNLNYIKSGCFTIFAATNPMQLKQSLEVINGVLNDLKNGKYTDEEIEKAKNQIVTLHELQQQTPSSQAENYALNELLGFGYDFDEKYLQMIKEGKKEDIKKAIEEYFKYSVSVITAPEK